MIVPTDGKFFFANDVMRSAFSGNAAVQPNDPDDSNDPPRPAATAQRKPNGRQ